jgi:hypothetical protein
MAELPRGSGAADVAARRQAHQALVPSLAALEWGLPSTGGWSVARKGVMLRLGP